MSNNGRTSSQSFNGKLGTMRIVTSTGQHDRVSLGPQDPNSNYNLITRYCDHDVPHKLYRCSPSPSSSSSSPHRQPQYSSPFRLCSLHPTPLFRTITSFPLLFQTSTTSCLGLALSHLRQQHCSCHSPTLTLSLSLALSVSMLKCAACAVELLRRALALNQSGRSVSSGVGSVVIRTGIHNCKRIVNDVVVPVIVLICEEAHDACLWI
jgi:hypothetical protein